MTHIDLFVVIGSCLVGFVVGATGAGGGALMTPMLTAVFGIHPAAAISSDLVSAVFMRPFGAAVHLRKGSVNLKLVRLLAIGSVPMALIGSVIFKYLSNGSSGGNVLRVLLGSVLLLGVAASLGKSILDRRQTISKQGSPGMVGSKDTLPISVQRRSVGNNDYRIIAVGALVGLLVGITSVGSGSLTVVMLLLLYPSFRAQELVGTDIVQSVPLSIAASAGALIFGHVAVAVTLSLILGSVPGVIAGSLLATRIPSSFVRLLVIMVSTAAGVSYVGGPAVFILGAVVLVVAVHQIVALSVQS